MLLALSLLCGVGLAAPAESIGSLGATLDLGPDWTRAATSPTLGKDQFHSTKGVYFVVQELRGTFLDGEDVRHRLSQLLVGIEQQKGKATSEMTDEERGGVLHAEQRWAVKAKGVELAYEVHVFAQGGLGYVMFAWSADKQRVQLNRVCRQFGRALHMPGASSEWAKLVPVVNETEVGDQVVRFGYSPQQFDLTPDTANSDAFAGIVSADERIRVYLLLETSSDAETLLGEALAKTSSLGEVEAEERVDATIDGRPARVAYFSGSAPGTPFAGAVAVVPAGDGTFLDLRFLTWGTFPSRKSTWEALIRSIDLEPAPRVDAFPIPDPVVTPTPLTAAQRGLLDAATVLGEPPYGDAWMLAGNLLYTHNYQGVRVLDLTNHESQAFTLPEDDSPGLPAAHGGLLYAPTSEGVVMRIVGDKAEPAGFRALRLADAGSSGLVLVRGPETTEVAGFGKLAAPAGQQLVLRADTGEERVLLTLHERTVEAMSVAGPDLLVAIEDPDGTWDERELVALDLADATVRSLGHWQSVGAVGADSTGWWVTGAPKGGASGVHRLSPTGERTLVLSGQHEAAAPLADGDLLLVTRWHPSAAGLEQDELVALRVPATALTKHGPRFDPLTVADVQAVAATSLATLKLDADPIKSLADPTRIHRFVEVASKASEARVGVALPRDAAGIDRLLATAQGDRLLGEEGYLLLVALLADHLLAEGAVWAEGRPPEGVVTFGETLDPVNDHAQGYLPQELVRSTLLDGEGWWNPAESSRRGVGGRKLVVGVDPDAIQARVASLERPGLETLATRPVPEVVEWLQVERENTWLRSLVYRRLAAAGRATELVAASAPFLLAVGTPIEDVEANLVGRVAQGVDAARAPALIAELRAAIGEHPERSSFYMLLGQVYEGSGLDEAKKLAAACYEHVAEGWTLREEAKEALARVH